jgi:hypothetical protein
MEKLAAVCPHVDEGESAIVWALRDEPVGETDSGWRLLCAAKEVGKIGTDVSWTIARLLREEPGLESHIERPVGTILQKEPGAGWRKWR